MYHCVSLCILSWSNFSAAVCEFEGAADRDDPLAEFDTEVGWLEQRRNCPTLLFQAADLRQSQTACARVFPYSGQWSRKHLPV